MTKLVGKVLVLSLFAAFGAYCGVAPGGPEVEEQPSALTSVPGEVSWGSPPRHTLLCGDSRIIELSISATARGAGRLQARQRCQDLLDRQARAVTRCDDRYCRDRGGGRGCPGPRITCEPDSVARDIQYSCWDLDASDGKVEGRDSACCTCRATFIRASCTECAEREGRDDCR